MTEAEWNACEDPLKMLDFLGGNVSIRKLRLPAVACCREVWPFLDDRLKNAVEITEKHADGMASQQHLDEASLSVFGAYEDELANTRPEIGPVASTVYPPFFTMTALSFRLIPHPNASPP